MKLLQQYDSIIWDWNGTLLNDIDLCVHIINQLLPNHNDLQLDKAHYQSVFGFPITDYYQRIGMDFQKESFEELTNKFIPSYMNQVPNCDLHPHVISVLNGFKAQNKTQYILTAAHQKDVLPLLDTHDIRRFFEAVYGLDNHYAASKIERGHHLMEHHRIDSNSAVLIGDTIHDYEVADAMGIDCILVANGHQSKERLAEKSNGQFMVLEEIHELLSFLS